MGSNTTLSGRKSEEVIVGYLARRGYKILSQNWRTRRCEIDIIAQKGSTIYFIEVKSRSTALQGRALDYITPQKQRQMQFAAEVWVARQGWQGHYSLGVAGVDRSLKKIEFIESV
jgi:uncharacterized protein (TIGR00252 family)